MSRFARRRIYRTNGNLSTGYQVLEALLREATEVAASVQLATCPTQSPRRGRLIAAGRIAGDAGSESIGGDGCN
jgi:hypothetical protein